MAAKPVAVDKDGGEMLWFGGGLVTFKVSSEDSDGAYIVIGDVAPRGKTTPLHAHPSFDETFYVVEGEILVHVDGEEHLVAAGGVAAAPRGVSHAFLVVSESAKWLTYITPGDVAERFLREGGDAVSDPSLPPPPLDIEKVKAAGERTGAMVVLGPPPFATVGAQR